MHQPLVAACRPNPHQRTIQQSEGLTISLLMSRGDPKQAGGMKHDLHDRVEETGVADIPETLSGTLEPTLRWLRWVQCAIKQCLRSPWMRFRRRRGWWFDSRGDR